jgi:hypothetical protein
MNELSYYDMTGVYVHVIGVCVYVYTTGVDVHMNTDSFLWEGQQAR